MWIRKVDDGRAGSGLREEKLNPLLIFLCATCHFVLYLLACSELLGTLMEFYETHICSYLPWNKVPRDGLVRISLKETSATIHVLCPWDTEQPLLSLSTVS